MKQRFNYLDLQVIRAELESQILNYRLQNIYDLTSSSHLFLLKFSVPDSKKHVIVDPGFRIHLTDYSRSTNQSPSGFVTKLRKHLKTRRLAKVSLAPENRLLVLTFSEQHSYHLVLEFFAGGNMILLNSDYQILSLQRVVSANDNQTRCAVGETYPLDKYLGLVREPVEFTSDLVRTWLSGTSSESSTPATQGGDDEEKEDGNRLLTEQPAAKKKGPKAIALKKLLYIKAPGIAEGIIEQQLLKFDIDPSLKSFDSILTETSGQALLRVVRALIAANELSQSIVSQNSVPGYIVAKKNPRFKPSADSESHESGVSVLVSPEASVNAQDIEYLFEDFQPFQPLLPKSSDPSEWQTVERATFNQAVDVYFSTLEATKLSLKISSQEMVAEKRLLAAKIEKEKRVKGLEQVQEKTYVMGLALQSYASRVEEAMDAVKGLMNQGMDWVDMENLIKVEKSRSNPVAQLISLPMNLIKNKITVELPDPTNEPEEDSDDDETDSSADESSDEANDDDRRAKPSGRTIKVEIDLGLSAWANSRRYFDMKKTAASKQERTVQQADQAYKSAEKKIQRDLHKSLEKEKGQQHSLHVIRETYWFEKFYWFVSSDGYLCIAGRDSFQNELLLRRYFKKNDIYVHCDVVGSSVVIVKNHVIGVIPPTTITQAGQFAVASSSKAWDTKMITSAWWATRDQIPRFTKEGEIVNTEFIVVEGEGKHFLPPCQLDMGLAFFWLVSEESKDKYSKPSLRTGPLGATEVVSDAQEATAAEERSDEGSDSEEEFPETQIESDDEFPDTELVSDDENDEAEVTETRDIETESEPEAPKEHIQEDAGDASVVEDAEVAKSGVDDAADGSQEESFVEKTGKKRLSAAERRRLKKQGSASATPEPETPTDAASSSVSDIERALDSLKVAPSSSEQTTQKPPKVRGKQGKLKKIATKYADQDDEERQQRMDQLGTVKGLERAKQMQQEAREKKEQQERSKRERQQRAKEAERKRLEAEDAQQGEDVDDTVYPFDLLVRKMVSGERPLGAVPMFGPWSALQKFKYKVKMQPGTVKKGKAVKDFIHALSSAKVDASGTDVDYPWPVEVALVKSIKEAEIILAVAVGKVKISIPGGGNSSSKNTSSKGGRGGKGGKRR